MMVERTQPGHLSEGPRPAGAQEQHEEEGENDEENIVIDMADEEDFDEEDEEEDEDEVQPVVGGEPRKQAPAAPASAHHFRVGDLVWFDPNQLGYCIPGKVIDYYQDLTLLTVRGYAQPAGDHQNPDNHNKQLLSADQTLQVYDLSDPNQISSLKPRRPLTNESGLGDLVELEELSSEALIWNLKLRYKQELIYTQCGHKILVSVNPFKQLANLYGLDQLQAYDRLSSGRLRSLAGAGAGQHRCNTNLIRWLLLSNSAEPAGKLPHLFRLANEALRRLLVSGQEQCFLLLGDSGAGKTEASKLLVQYLASVNKAPSNLLTEQILEAVQLLESFGNAKTPLNDNSSRFGKLLEISFDLASGFIARAKVTDLNLLDRGRIVSQGEGERNYHAFYELLAGLAPAEREKYGLQAAEKYFYLNQGHCVRLPGKEDADDFRSLLASLQVLGFNYEEQDTVFRILASVLHLGNVYFHRKVLAVRSGRLAQQQQQIQQTDGGLSEPAGIEGVEIGSDTEVRWVSHLLQIQFEAIMRCLTVRTTETSSTVAQPDSSGQLVLDRVVTPLNIDQALDTRDAIARALYASLFKWLVQRINATIGSNPDAESRDDEEPTAVSQPSEPIYLSQTHESVCEFQPDRISSRQSSLARKATSVYSLSSSANKQLDVAQLQSASITIMDAFGFENLAENNFEQLCVNYTAELLHYHTLRYLLRLEQAEYARERLRWTPVRLQLGASVGQLEQATSAATNHPAAVVNLISKKPLGILALLDDECNFPKATDQSFLEKCHHNHTLNENYQRARLDGSGHEFGVRHFGQPSRLVWYQADGFIEKNRDSLRPDVVELLANSRVGIVADMLRKLNQLPGNPDGQANSFSSANTRTISRTFDGRYVAMKPRATSVAARFQETLHNNKAMESINYGGSSATGSLPRRSNAPGQLPAEAGHYSSGSPRAGQTPSKPNPWFVVCIKPNRSRASGVFDVAYVQEQVRAMNLLELVQMRKLGFPVRMRYGEFVRRYKCLVPQKFLNNLSSCKDIQAANQRMLSRDKQRSASKGKLSNADIKRAIRDVCSAIVEFRFTENIKNQYQCGQTKMFLNERLYQTLEEMRLAEHQEAICLIQKTLKMWLVRRDFLLRRQAAVVIQSQLRGWLARQRFWRQYYLIVSLQRHWRHFLELKRHRALEAKRRARRLQQQKQLQELQAQQRMQANQFRHRLQPNQLSSVGPGAGSLDIPDVLAQLYKLQRDWQPVHELSHLNEVNLNELIARERGRVAKHPGKYLSVPFIAGELDPGWKESRTRAAKSEPAKRILMESEESDRFCLENFIREWFTLEAPQFGYSRLPITRPFRWRIAPEELADKTRFRMFELKALSMYKLLLRYIDSDSKDNQNPDQREQTRRLAKFKLIADYVIFHCLAEPMLRDELYLQLASQSWQNPRPKSTENAWKLLVTCLGCFPPSSPELAQFLLKYAQDYCNAPSRNLILARLSEYLANGLDSARNCPPTMVEYCANQRALDRMALAASCYMDDAALNGPIEAEESEFSLEEVSTTNHANKTLVEVKAQTCAEELASCVLEARRVPAGNRFGWTVEIQQEGGHNELISGRLRGDDCILDQLSRAEMLPEFVELIELADDRLRAELRSAAREQKVANLQHEQRNQGSRQARYSSEFPPNGNRRAGRVSSELDLTSARLSQSSKLNQRYNDFLNNPNELHANEGYHSGYRMVNGAPEVGHESTRLHRRSMSMQELKLASSALNGRYFYNGAAPDQSSSHHYAASHLAPGYQPAGGRRRSQTPNSMKAGHQHRLSSSAYGSYATQAQFYYDPEEGCQPGGFEPKGSEASSQNCRPRRSASSSSRFTGRAPSSSQSDHYSVGPANSRCTESSAYHSDYERIGPSYRARYNGGLSEQTPRRLKNPHNHRKGPLGDRHRRGQNQLRPDNQAADASGRLQGVQPDAPAEDFRHVRHKQHPAGSSALSDTSEAPSLASHVRGIKVPQNNNDLDQYLDDLFNPLLDEVGLNDDDLSDARSMANSFKGRPRPDEQLSNLFNAKNLSRIIRGLDEQDEQSGENRKSVGDAGSKEGRLSPTFELLLKSLRDSSTPSQLNEMQLKESGNSIEIYPEQGPSVPAELGNMNLSELKALNEKLESEILVAQSKRPSLEIIGSSIPAPPPPPPPQPSFGGADDIYDRAKTVRIGKWRWPPAREALSAGGEEASEPKPEEEINSAREAQILNYYENQERRRLSAQSNSPQNAKAEAENKENKPETSSSQPPEAKLENNDKSASNIVGKLKISSEMKAKLEKLTTGSGGQESSSPAPLESSHKSKETVREVGVSRLNEQRRQLLENQLAGNSQQARQSESDLAQLQGAGGKVLAAKQQLAAAAGVALTALDSSPSSQASSRRQSALVTGSASSEAAARDASGPESALASEERRSRVLRDELGPQSRSAISQRQAFYQMSASSERLEEIAPGQVGAANSEAQLNKESLYPAPAPLPAVSSDNLTSGPAGSQQPLVRAMQMSANLNEAGRSSELGRESDRLYGQSIAKSLSQRQQESLKKVARGPRPPKGSNQRLLAEHQWVSSSPDPTLESAGRRLQRNKRTGAEQGRPSKRRLANAGPQGDQLQPTQLVCLTYANVDWQVRVRKELFRPSETYDEPLVLQLIFAQLVADVFNPRHWTRLNQKERAAIKALMRDNSIGYAPSLPQIGQLQPVKRELVRMARSFGLYFTRSYPAGNFACAPEVGARRRRNSASGRSSPSGSSDEEARRENPALRLAQRLRNANNLGLERLDLVGVHHSGLRLVRLAAAVDSAPGQPAAGYKVLETLKYRDMTDVSQVSRCEILVSMRNGKKCWLISSKQATRLVALLRDFHADYNDHLKSQNSAGQPHLSAEGTPSVQSKLIGEGQRRDRNNEDALLASDDDHHGDHREQRQTSDRLGALHSPASANDDLAHSRRVLPDALADSNQKTQHHQLAPPPAPPQQQPAPPGDPAPESVCRKPPAPNGPAEPAPSSVALDDQGQAEFARRKSKNLWQNSLSRMSNKFSIFSSGGTGQSRKKTPADKSEPGNNGQQVLPPAVTLDAWIETKVDFDQEDETEPESGQSLAEVASGPTSPRGPLAAPESLPAAADLLHQQQQQQQASKQEREDGKYSLLQFALYNFREAIDKYSLESRASKAQLAPGDTSTLRGSLKLIESLRSHERVCGEKPAGARQETGRRASKLLKQLDGPPAANSDWTWRELAQMVKFTKAPIRQSLLKLPTEELNKRAVDCFLAIMQYMGDAPANSKAHLLQEGEVECVYLILMNCHNFAPLRDEIYCQLIKQTTNNRSESNPDSCLKGWRLFSIVAAYFDCSQPFKPYLLKYLETAAYDKRRAYCSVALLCLQNLRKTFKYKGRKNVPSVEEIAATSAGRNSKRQIYRLPGGTERVINTKSTTVVEDIIHEICSNMFNITDQNEMLEFSLYCIADGDLYTMPLNRDEYILDITTELIKNHQQYFLIFCRSIWHYPLRLDSKLYIEVIFNQIAPDYLEGLLLVLPSLRFSLNAGSRPSSTASGSTGNYFNEPLRLKAKMVKEIARIAALLHRASGTDYMPHKDEVKYLLPKPIIAAMKQQQRNSTTLNNNGNNNNSRLSSNGSTCSGSGDEPRHDADKPTNYPHSQDTVVTTPQKWIELVQSNWREMSAFDTLDAKAQFLDIVRHWPLFGSSFFAIKLIQRDLIQPMDFILALNKLGIQMLDTITHETVHKYPFNEVISTRKVRSEDGALFLDMKCGNLMKRTIVRIQTDQAHEISRLIKQYIDIELLQQKQQQQPTPVANNEDKIQPPMDQINSASISSPISPQC